MDQGGHVTAGTPDTGGGLGDQAETGSGQGSNETVRENQGWDDEPPALVPPDLHPQPCSGSFLVPSVVCLFQRQPLLRPSDSSWKSILFGLFFKKINLTYLFYCYLFLAALGLCCCTWAFSSCGERGVLFVAARGLLIAVASLVAEHRL